MRPRIEQDVKGDEPEMGVLSTRANWSDHSVTCDPADEQVNGLSDRGGLRMEAAVHDQSGPHFVNTSAQESCAPTRPEQERQMDASVELHDSFSVTCDPFLSPEAILSLGMSLEHVELIREAASFLEHSD